MSFPTSLCRDEGHSNPLLTSCCRIAFAFVRAPLPRPCVVQAPKLDPACIVKSGAFANTAGH
eukprot:1138036-Pelagomonas_calceolata.AAC.6